MKSFEEDNFEKTVMPTQVADLNASIARNILKLKEDALKLELALYLMRGGVIQ